MDPLAPLSSYPQFILYKLVPRPDGKTDKLPVDHRTLCVFQKGDDWQQDPTAWTTQENATKLAALCGPDYGVGFFFTASDPFFFLDIDYCLTGPVGQVVPSALASTLMQRLPGAAVEVSQSGTGLHIFGTYTGPAPDHSKKNEPLGLELYTEKRFVALTGDRAIGSAGTDCTAALGALVTEYFPPKERAALGWTDEPVPEYTGPTDDDELIRRACASTSAASAFGGGKCGFAALWDADEDALQTHYPAESGGYDASRADAALAQHLAFWTGKNCERMRGLMLRSALVREKWETHSSYLEITIENAVAMQTRVYSVTAAEDGPPAPKLKGSDKQREYAEQIRAEKLAACGDLLPQLTVKHGPSTEASFWLDNRDKTPEELATMIRPLESAPTQLGPEDGPQVTAGYQYLGGEQQIDFFKGCVYVQESHRVFTPAGVMLKAEQFNASFGGYVFQLDDSGNKTTRKAFEAFTESQLVRYPKAEATCFRPDLEPGALVERDGRVLVNSYVPVQTERRPGDVSRFLRHLALVLPDERDQSILLAYMAACVQHKGVKFQWAPLIQGVEGNGKTLFTRCVAYAIGEKYVHMPPAQEIAEKFNAWLFDKLFIGVEDIYVQDQKREILEVLKPMITNERLPCRAMQQSQVMRDCCANFLFNSNHQDGVRKTQNDRRFATFFCAQQIAEHLTRDGMVGDYFPNLYAWLRGGGYAAVNDFLHTYAIPDELNPATGCHRAPKTSTTEAAISAGLGGVEQEILEAIDEDRPGFAGGWVSSVYIERLLKDLRREGAIPPNKRRDLMRSLGYDWHPALNDGRVNNSVMPDGKKPRLFIKNGHIHLNLTTPRAVADAYEAAQRRAVDGAGISPGEAFTNAVN